MSESPLIAINGLTMSFFPVYTFQVLDDQKVSAKICGKENLTDDSGKELILSQGNSLTLIFQTSGSTDELQQHNGFSATYKAIGRAFLLTSFFLECVVSPFSTNVSLGFSFNYLLNIRYR